MCLSGLQPLIEASFQALKQALMYTLVLAMPNFELPFIIEIDASSKGIGAVLQQQGHPIAYVSKALGVKAWVSLLMRKSI